ncbi:hypothetical protein NFI96_013467 [Prochilodus magdalenae]|nr:hypothetical protein NFI96_013467 [Prochilodus magdalenae]
MESYKGRTALFKDELLKGNTSLKLSAIRPSDEGAYKCFVQFGPVYDDAIIYVEVKEKAFHTWKIVIICISVFIIGLIAFVAYILKDKFSEKKLSPAQCSVIAYMRLHSENVRNEWNLKKYHTSAEGYRRLIPAITNCRKARLVGCNLTAQSIDTLQSVLQTENSSLKDLDLSYNGQQNLLEKLFTGLRNSHCRLETLRLVGCNLTTQSIDALRSILHTENSSLKDLDLSYNGQQDLLERLFTGPKNSHCTLETLRLITCNLTAQSIDTLQSVLQTEHSSLKDLDLSYNGKQDLLESLFTGLTNSHCRLETLRSTDDAIALTVHSALTHLDRKNTYVRTQFIDYSSAFNTIIPAKLIPKLTDLGLNSHLCNWVLDFLTDTHPTLSSQMETRLRAYRDKVSTLSGWCYHNNLSLNISKTKEMIVDYRKLQRSGHSPLYINGAEVVRVSSVRFLGVHLTDDLSWSLHTSKAVRSVHQPLLFLRRLRKFGLLPDILTNLNRCTIESILTACITVWYGSCTAYDRKALKRVVRTVESIIGSKLPDLQDIYRSRCLRKIQKILLDCSHPAHDLFTLLPSGRRYHSIQARTNRLKNSFYPQAIRFLNKLLVGCNLTAQLIDTLQSVLQTENSSLKHLDLSNNGLQDSLESLSAGLKNSHCRLETLRLVGCNLTAQSIDPLQSVLQIENSSMKELDIGNNDLEDSGVELLTTGLKSKHCALVILRSESPNIIEMMLFPAL